MQCLYELDEFTEYVPMENNGQWKTMKNKSLSNQVSTSIFNSTCDGVLITDADNHILEVNKAFTQVTGYNRDEIIGKSPSILKSGRHSAVFYQEMWRSLQEQGHWQGEIWDRRKNGEIYLERLSITQIKDDDGKVIQHVAVFTDIHQLRLAQTKMEQLAHFDGLTELPNRTLFAVRLGHAIASARRSNSLIATLILDLDGFKAINDHYGHEIGDRLLLIIAQRLKQIVRSGDTVARLGGDEFALILSGLPNMDALEQVLQQTLTLCAAPCDISGHKHQLTASLGVTLFPFDSADPDTLLRHADQAMYQAKQTGRNRYHLFDAQQDQVVHSRFQLMERLALGLTQNELRLYYQPKVNLRTGQIIGMEALLRWQHPELGLLLPDTFLPHIEHSDLINEIGERVIRDALTQALVWHNAGLPISVSVNVAAHHLQRPDFLDCLKDCLLEYPDLPPGRLEIEILESAALDNTQHVRNVIEACRELGVSFALDDFGTGYASLAYLREIPADTLKIDQSFVRDVLDNPDALTLVEGAIGLATAFRRVVVAEGVENAEQGVLLMRLGCDIAQGHGISPAMPADQVISWVEQYRPDPQWALWADTKWEMSDFPLLVAQYDHLKWVRQIMLYLSGATLKLSQPELRDHHSCRFGHWYYGHGTIRYGHLQAFKDLEPIHAAVHRIGPVIIQLKSENQTEAAQLKSQELLKLKDRILKQLALLQQAVADVSPTRIDTSQDQLL